MLSTRCTACILPEGYPGIQFNPHGVCNHCLQKRSVPYKGAEALKDFILGRSKDRQDNEVSDYDCLLMVSGGRDSSFLLYFLSVKLHLKVFAYFLDTGFAPPHTIENVKRITANFKTDLFIDHIDTLKKCSKVHLNAWLARPTAATLGLICVGCKLAYLKGAIHHAARNRIRTIIDGGTPFEGGTYKLDLLQPPWSQNRKIGTPAGLAIEFIRNPRWVSNWHSLAAQFEEYAYLHSHFSQKVMARHDIMKVLPFFDYVHWNEQDISAALAEMGWKKHPNLNSAWRSDCILAPLRAKAYKQMLGFNDIDDHLSQLIRDGQLGRAEAMKRLNLESAYPDEVIRESCAMLGVDFPKFQAAIDSRKASRPPAKVS